MTTTFRDRIHPILMGIEDMLVEKNVAYGDSALNPVRVFSTADPVEQIRVRIDDKLSRLARGKAAGEDTRRDLIGYLVLLELAENELAPQEAMVRTESRSEQLEKLIARNRLRPSDAKVLRVINSLVLSDGSTCVSATELAEASSLSIHTVWECIRSMTYKGLITEIGAGSGDGRRMRINLGAGLKRSEYAKGYAA